MGMCMLGVRSAELTVRRKVWVESFVVFARMGMISDGAGHAAHGLDIVARHGHKELSTSLIYYIRLEEPTFLPYRKPIVAFVHLGCC